MLDAFEELVIFGESLWVEAIHSFRPRTLQLMPKWIVMPWEELIMPRGVHVNYERRNSRTMELIEILFRKTFIKAAFEDESKGWQTVTRLKVPGVHGTSRSAPTFSRDEEFEAVDTSIKMGSSRATAPQWEFFEDKKHEQMRSDYSRMKSVKAMITSMQNHTKYGVGFDHDLEASLQTYQLFSRTFNLTSIETAIELPAMLKVEALSVYNTVYKDGMEFLSVIGLLPSAFLGWERQRR